MAHPTPEEMFSLWRAARLVSARYKPTGVVVELDGVTISDGDLRWSAVNHAFFSRPVVDETDAARRLEAARGYFRRRERRWNLILWNEWVTEPVRAALERDGFKPTYRTYAMVAERLRAGRSWPTELECRRVVDEAGRITVMEINALAYGAPLEYAQELGQAERLFESDHVYVGWVDGRPVSTAVVGPVEGWLYVHWVATLPEYRRRGYAEALVRHGYLAASRAHGTERTMLVSTEDGCSLYEAMGYRDVIRFTYFSPG